MYEIKICRNCGSSFIPVRKNQVFCKDNDCYNKVHRKRMEKIELVCPNCGQSFQSTKKQKYCSEKCRKEIKSKRNKEYREKEGIRMKCVICKKRFISKTKTPICSTTCKKIFKENNNG